MAVRRSEKPVTAACGLEIAARARCNHPSAPRRVAPSPCPLCRGARDPNGATGGCDGPEAARRVAALRSVPRPADGARGRSDGNHVSTLVSFPVRRGVSRRPPARPTTTRAALFSLPLSLSLSISFSPPAPIPIIPAPPFTANFSFFFTPVGSSSHPRPLLVFANCRHSRGWPTTSRARRPCATIVEECYPSRRRYVTARRLAPCPVCALNTGLTCGRVGSHRIATATTGVERKEGRRCNAARGRTCWLRAAVAPAREDVKVRGFNERRSRCHARLSPRRRFRFLSPCTSRGVVHGDPGNLRIALNFNRRWQR